MDYTGDSRANTFRGANGEGNRASGLGGDDKLYGGDASDILYGGIGGDQLTGNDGDDVLDSETTDLYADDSKHADPLAVDRLSGGAGDDQIHAGYGDIISGGSGFDTLWLDLSGATKGVTIDFDSSGQSANGTGTITGIEFVSRLIGSEHSDSLNIAAVDGDLYNSASVSGEGGNDRIWGGEHDNTLFGDAGDDTLHGGGGNDTLFGGESTTNSDGTDKLYGDAGDDFLYIGFNDTADGGSDSGMPYLGDHVQLDLSDAATGVTMDFSGIGHGGTIANGTGSISHVELLDAVIGSDFADTLVLGNAQTDNGGSLFGGAGDDRLTGGADNDTMGGDSGDDTVWGAAGFDQINGGTGADQLHGGADDDQIDGGSGSDKLWGDDGNDTLDGGTGNDVLQGGNGDDHLEDRSGHDSLHGGDGDDWLSASAGSHLYGEGGDDRLYVNHDALVDGGSGYDTIALSYGGTSTAKILDFSVLGATGSGTVDGVQIMNVEGYGEIYGSDANDTITLGDFAEGPARLNGGAGLVEGGGGDDHLIGGAGTNTLIGDSGNDTLEGQGGDDVLNGGDGRDHLMGGAGNDALSAGGGGDRLDGGSGNDTITTTIDYDTTRFSTITGGSGDDAINAHWGDRIDGGSGTDSLSVDDGDRAAPLIFDYTSGSVVIDGATISGIEEVGQWLLGFGDDVVTMGALTMKQYGQIDGQGGNDSLVGGTGGDTFFGNIGNDKLTGNGGDDHLDGSDGNDRLYGDDGNDLLSPGFGSDRVDGGSGTDTLSFSDISSAVTVDLTKGSAQIDGSGKDVLVSIENVIGGYGDDHLIGNGSANVFTLVGGHDVIDGGGGSDTLAVSSQYYFSGVSVDLSRGQAFDFYGNPLADVTSIENLVGSISNDILTGDGHANQIRGDDGDDQLFGGGGTDTLVGGDGNDRLDGGVGQDALYGGLGDDTYVITSSGDAVHESKNAGTDTVESAISYTLDANVENLRLTAGAVGHGNSADNSLTGSAANDTLVGEAGNDRLDGQIGSDVLTGGAGADHFVFSDLTLSEKARITDFHASEGDVLDFTGLRTTTSQEGVNAIDYVGTHAFSGEAGQARIELHSGYGVFMLDWDGDKTADLVIRLDGVAAANDVHFVF